MQAQVYHWFEGTKKFETIDNLEQWIIDHGGAVQVYPPAVNSLEGDLWVVAITDSTNRFNQK